MVNLNSNTAVNDLINSVSNQANPALVDISAKANASLSNFWSNFLSINWAQPTWDIFILLFFIATILIYGFALGRGRIVTILISTYLSLAVATNMPFMDQLALWLNNTLQFAFQVSAFLAVFVVLFIFLQRSSLLSGLSSDRGGLLQTIIFALLQVGLFLSIILSFLPADFVGQLSELVHSLFLTDTAKFIWIIAPIVALIFFHGRKSEQF